MITDTKTLTTQNNKHEINELAFENWCKKHITVIVAQYKQKPDYQDLIQDAWLIAYQDLRACQAKQLPINYPILKAKLIERLERKYQEYNNGGITYSGDTDITIEDDIENKAIC